MFRRRATSPTGSFLNSAARAPAHWAAGDIGWCLAGKMKRRLYPLDGDMLGKGAEVGKGMQLINVEQGLLNRIE